MSIVEKMVRVYATTLTDAKLSAIEEIRERLLSALTATGLTEAQLEGLAKGDLVILPNPLKARERADAVADRAILAAKEGSE